MKSDLGALNGLMKDKEMFLQRKNEEKAARKMRKMEKNWRSYIKIHQKMPELLMAANRIGEIAFQLYRSQKLESFRILTSQSLTKKPFLRSNSQLKSKLKQPLIKLLLNPPTIQTQLNKAFQKLKTHSHAPHQEQTLQNLRIFQFEDNSIENCFQISDHLDGQAGEMQESVEEFIGMAMEDGNQFGDDLEELEREYARLDGRCKEIRLGLEDGGLGVDQGSFWGAQNQQGDQSKSQAISQRASQSKPKLYLELSHDESLKIQQSREAIAEFLDRYECLNQQADAIGVVIDSLLQPPTPDPNLDPHTLAILNQIRQILQPCPLGLSQIVQ